jgi:sugar transferase (PEP-CTERM/EpsH1 system associated)
MRLLFICHRYPFPPKRGGKIRPFNIIRHLSESGHEVHVGSLVRSDIEQQEGDGLEQHCASAFHARVTKPVQAARMVMRLPSRVPSSMGYFYSPELRDHVHRLLNKHSFDAAFVHCSSVAQYVAKIPIRKHLDFGDMDSQKWLEYSQHKPFPMSLGYRIEGSKLMTEERRLSKVFDQCSATTRGELETLRSLNPSVKGDWFPNGVDGDFFKPVTDYDPDQISFVGRLDYFPNQQGVIDFANGAFPKIRARRRGARFIIVGAEPPPFIKALERIEGVTVTGTVPDVRPYVTKSALTVAPLFIARGTQNKILEAMSMGVPVVSSTPASKGVDAIAGEHLEVADSAPDVAEKCLQLMDSPERRRALSEAGLQRVRTHHSWKASMAKFDQILQRLTS